MSTPLGNRHMVEELIVRKADKLLRVRFEDGASFDIAFELLRVESPSAEVQGHSPQEKVLVAGKSAVIITAIEPVGNYAIKISFDDLHSTGLYMWDYLYWLGENQADLMQHYEQALAQAGLSRFDAPPATSPKGGCGCGSGGHGGCG